jgi:hypothetical protein
MSVFLTTVKHEAQEAPTTLGLACPEVNPVVQREGVIYVVGRKS